jgi:hypothetical protein
MPEFADAPQSVAQSGETWTGEAPMHRGTIRRCGSAFLLATYLTGCTSWRAQNVAPERVLQDSNLVRKGVRITTLDGQRFKVEHPTLRADTLTGTRDTAAVAVPLGQIRELEVRRLSAQRTALLVAGSLVGAAAAALGVMCIYLCGMTD